MIENKKKIFGLSPLDVNGNMITKGGEFFDEVEEKENIVKVPYIANQKQLDRLYGKGRFRWPNYQTSNQQ